MKRAEPVPIDKREAKGLTRSMPLSRDVLTFEWPR